MLCMLRIQPSLRKQLSTTTHVTVTHVTHATVVCLLRIPPSLSKQLSTPYVSSSQHVTHITVFTPVSQDLPIFCACESNIYARYHSYVVDAYNKFYACYAYNSVKAATHSTHVTHTTVITHVTQESGFTQNLRMWRMFLRMSRNYRKDSRKQENPNIVYAENTQVYAVLRKLRKLKMMFTQFTAELYTGLRMEQLADDVGRRV
jgi:hypothetical protein